MESQVATGLRSRSRSKTPFLRSSCDRESCGDAEHTHKSGRKTPSKNTTPQHLSVVEERHTPEPTIDEIDEQIVFTSPPAHRTRAATAATTVKTSDYSSEESPDRLRSTEQLQNKLNSHYEYSRVTTTSTARRGWDSGGGTIADFRLSPSHHSSPYSHSYNASHHRSFSPAHSACSTDSSFAEQAMQDISKVTERDHSYEHLPYKLYKMAGEYWNKYPKTDYTYSPLSRDRVELAPGQVAIPNMSRRSLAQFRVHGAVTSDEEIEQLIRQHGAAWQTQAERKHASYESSEDESSYRRANGGYTPVREHWLLTRFFIALYTSVVTTLGGAYRRLSGADRPYSYTDAAAKKGVVSRSASAVAAPLVWIYSLIKTVVTTTTTTITNTISGNNAETDGAGGAALYRARANSAYASASSTKKRRVWPWLLLLLPLVAYGSYYTYEHFDDTFIPDFSSFNLSLPEFSDMGLHSLSLPNLTVPSLQLNLSLPELPDVQMPQAYYDYKDIAQNRMSDASEYVKVVAGSCYEEIKRFVTGATG